MIKFGRNYKLTIEANGREPIDVVINYPITLRFDVTRDQGSSINLMNLAIYNLSKETRDQIYQDRYWYFTNDPNQSNYRKITLQAGYGNNLSTIFQGNLVEAGHTRRGSDILTIICARDGDFDTRTTNSFFTLQQGTDLNDLIRRLIQDFPNLKLGAIADSQVKLQRAVTVNGATMQLLKTYTDQNIFIDLEKVYIVNNNNTIEFQGEVPIISAETGLLETPLRNDSYLEVTTLFEPNILLGQSVQLLSDVMPIYNGTYKVCSIYHSGVISGAINGNCTSTFGLLIDGSLFGKFVSVPAEVQRVNLNTPSIAGTDS